MSLFWPYYGSLKGFQSNPCRLAATKSADAFDVQGTVPRLFQIISPQKLSLTTATWRFGSKHVHGYWLCYITCSAPKGFLHLIQMQYL